MTRLSRRLLRRLYLVLGVAGLCFGVVGIISEDYTPWLVAVIAVSSAIALLSLLEGLGRRNE